MLTRTTDTKHTASCALSATLAATLTLTLALAPAASGLGAARAFAETTDIDAQADAAQQQIEQTAAAYDEASARVADLDAQIADNEQRISELEESLPEQQERSAQSVRLLYKMQQNAPGLVDMILDAENLSDFFTIVEYVTHIQNSNVAEIERLQTMKDELETTRGSLDDARAQAQTEQANAEQALAQAQAAREEAQRKAQEEAERQAAEAQAAAEEAARKAAEEQAAADAAAQQAADAAAAQATPAPSSEPAGTPSPDGADWSSDKAAFVDAWAARIDAYLAGSPLAGQGRTFAEAAWNYGVDPRWSPAISAIESTKGTYCFQPHNAWGWGNVSWSSWEEAIDAHVAGLARGYGYTLSVEAAKKYNPGNWEHWYNSVLAQMEQI